MTMVLGAFRENVWFSMGDNGVNLVGWLIDPITLWHKHKETYMRDLNSIASTINAPSFGNAFLQNPAIYNSQFTSYHFGVNVTDSINRPEVIYQIDTNTKYLIDKTNIGTFWLECDVIDPELPPMAELITHEKPNLTRYLISNN
jgi:hypothetical protein